MLTLDKIAEITGAEILCKSSNQEILSFSTDTRTIQKGDFYIPLKGDNFDGEEFIQNAVEKGALGYFTTENTAIENVNVLKVNDTKEAYLKLANFRRNQVNPKVIMITGSSGKTTSKELIYSVCSQKYKTVRTYLNHNNEIGFCQTVFLINDDTEILIIEAGMRGLGEIELISKYARPDITVITNTGTAHIGRLGSRENIAKAKCEITKYQNPKGVFIAHNDELIKKTVDFKGKKIYYSLDDAKITDKKIGFQCFEYKNEKYTLNIDGMYNIENSIPAIEIGKLLDIGQDLISKGLREYKPIEKRWDIQKIKGYNVINDCYNANPDSMKAAIETVLDLYEAPVIVLGDMAELGEDEIYYHKNTGEFINKKNTNSAQILTVGTLSKYISDEITTCPAKHFSSNDEVRCYILDNIKIGTTIFLKASRSMKLEEILS